MVGHQRGLALNRVDVADHDRVAQAGDQHVAPAAQPRAFELELGHRVGDEAAARHAHAPFVDLLVGGFAQVRLAARPGQVQRIGLLVEGVGRDRFDGAALAFAAGLDDEVVGADSAHDQVRALRRRDRERAAFEDLAGMHAQGAVEAACDRKGRDVGGVPRAAAQHDVGIVRQRRDHRLDAELRHHLRRSVDVVLGQRLPGIEGVNPAGAQRVALVGLRYLGVDDRDLAAAAAASNLFREDGQRLVDLAVGAAAASRADEDLGAAFLLRVEQEGQVAPDHLAVAEERVGAEVVRTRIGAARIDRDQVDADAQGTFDRALGKAVTEHAVRKHDELALGRAGWGLHHQFLLTCILYVVDNVQSKTPRGQPRGIPGVRPATHEMLGGGIDVTTLSNNRSVGSAEKAPLDIRVERGLSLSESATALIARAIYLGHFQPGDHLGEAQLSQVLGVSRTMVREAFRTLAAEGLIEVRRNFGASVIQPSAEDIEQMSVFRAINEGLAVHMLVARQDEVAFGKLDRIVHELQAPLEADDANGFLDLHWKYHQTIVEHGANRFLLQSWNSVSRIIRMYQRNTPDRSRLLRNNRVLLQTFRTATPERAEALVRGQIIKAAYELLDRPIPPGVRGYVTLYIDAAGRVRSY